MANDFHAWKAIPNLVFDKTGIRSVFHYNFEPSKNTSQKISLLPQFYQELVSFWESVSGKQPSCISEIVGQCIWNNTYIIKQGSTIFHTRLYKSGIMIINDLIDTENHLWLITSQAHQGKRAPGLCSKSYCIKGADNGMVKVSMKGVNKNQFDNPMAHYQESLESITIFRATNLSIRRRELDMTTYCPMMDALTLLSYDGCPYILLPKARRRTTVPLDIYRELSISFQKF